jgi:hypothetical protein
MNKLRHFRSINTTPSPWGSSDITPLTTVCASIRRTLFAPSVPIVYGCFGLMMMPFVARRTVQGGGVEALIDVKCALSRWSMVAVPIIFSRRVNRVLVAEL